MVAELAPAIGGHLAVFGVQPHDDVAAKRSASVLQKARVLHRSGANDDVAQTRIQVAFDSVQVANAAAQLHVDLAAHGLQNLADGSFVFRLPRKGTVQIHQMQPARAFVHPGASHYGGVFAECGGLVHIALFEANAVTVFEINSRY